MRKRYLFFVLVLFSFATKKQQEQSWIRINWLGYQTKGIKVAVWCSRENISQRNFNLVDARSGKVVFTSAAGKQFGAYGPFLQSYRFNFSAYKKPGRYYLEAGGVKSPEFLIGEDVYKGAADFCLRYMRQQRSGFNPFLKDSCHTHDGYTLYGPMPDSTHLDVSGGWHDASDYLQYSTTSANATYHLLMAYRDFANVFDDKYEWNGLDGKNGTPDVLDEAKWGLDWLLKMHPRDDWMFNQLADDRDHKGMRIPKEDSFYGRGKERPVYFCSGRPQVRGKFMNNTTGVSSTAAKFVSAFALASEIYSRKDPGLSNLFVRKCSSAIKIASTQHGICQTASVLSPYIYAEGNWVDDMELAFTMLSGINPKLFLDSAKYYARQEKITPWLGADTASHYEWYPFINLGHYELAKKLKGKSRDTIISFYKQGIERVWLKARNNAFLRGIPFIWCSNNLTVSFAMQCYWYRQLSGDMTYMQLEQACFDWLLGCNPWGTSMIYGLPSWGDTPVDPHSAFTHMKKYPIDGGLVDGPVYGSIYKNLIGITLYEPDEYSAFQSDLVVYHDDYGDYSTNEPTMDGTASLIYLLAAKESESNEGITKSHGAILRGDSSKRQIALVFTADEFAEGGKVVSETLDRQKIKSSFFFTGRFYRNPKFRTLIEQLKSKGHYLGAHSDQHLLYCDWDKRDRLLVSKKEFARDLAANYQSMEAFGISKKDARFFLPPYEWYNDSISVWARNLGLQLINFTPGTLSAADYTWPELENYHKNGEIQESIMNRHENYPSGLNGFILLVHIGTDPRRTDKFYHRLPMLVSGLEEKGYRFVRVDELLRNQ